MTLKKDNRITTLWRLGRKAYGGYQKQIFSLTFLSLISGVLEGVGVNSLIPLFAIVMGTDDGHLDFISRAIKKVFALMGVDFNLIYILIFISLLFIGKAFVSILIAYVRGKITYDYQEKISNSLLEKIMRADWPHLMKQKLGHLETIILVDAPAASSLLNQLSAIITTLITMVVYLLVALNISVPVTLLTLLIGLVSFLIIKPYIYRSKKMVAEIIDLNKKTAHRVSENILGAKTIKATLAEQGVLAKSGDYFKSAKNISVKLSILKSGIDSFITPLSIIFICVLFALTYKIGILTFSALVAVVYLIQRIFTYLQQLQQNFHSVNSLVPYLQSCLAFERDSALAEEKNSGARPFVFEKELTLKNVNFNYTPNAEVLRDINLTLHRGQMLGIIGPSGVGKTTLVDILLRFLKPQSGEITLDGRDARDIDIGAWRANIGYVSQDIFLLNGTIADNIRFFNPNISEAKLIKAARMANIYEFISVLPEKFETPVGERGLSLSAGQRQRIAIARVLAREPKILILDEATSSLDNESEIKIQEVIGKIKGQISVVVIAHRLSTIRNADNLIVLENGQVAEQGKPAELLKDKDSYFFKVYNLREN